MLLLYRFLPNYEYSHPHLPLHRLPPPIPFTDRDKFTAPSFPTAHRISTAKFYKSPLPTLHLNTTQHLQAELSNRHAVRSCLPLSYTAKALCQELKVPLS